MYIKINPGWLLSTDFLSIAREEGGDREGDGKV